MNKTEFVDAVAKKAEITKTEAHKVITAVLDTITETLAKEDKIVLTGFGTFRVRETKARNGINPQTKEKIVIPASKRPTFSAGAVLKKAVEGKKTPA
jgi:DNA-binding protein HU-beta